MDDSGPLPALGWLIFAVGIGVILIAIVPRKTQMRSATRRFAGVLSGLVFCLLAATVIIPGLPGSAQKGLAVAAAICGGTSWYLGLHARKMDRMARARK
jgi:hypothetical protein